MLVAANVLHTDPVKIVDGCAQADRIGDVAGAGLETRRGWLVDSLLKSDIDDHVAATLPRRRLVEQILFPEDCADASRSVHLMA